MSKTSAVLSDVCQCMTPAASWHMVRINHSSMLTFVALTLTTILISATKMAAQGQQKTIPRQQKAELPTLKMPTLAGQTTFPFLQLPVAIRDSVYTELLVDHYYEIVPAFPRPDSPHQGLKLHKRVYKLIVRSPQPQVKY